MRTLQTLSSLLLCSAHAAPENGNLRTFLISKIFFVTSSKCFIGAIFWQMMVFTDLQITPFVNLTVCLVGCKLQHDSSEAALMFLDVNIGNVVCESFADQYSCCRFQAAEIQYVSTNRHWLLTLSCHLVALQLEM